METVPVANTLNELIKEFKSRFFDKATRKFVDSSRCTDAATYSFKAELVSAIGAIRDSEGRSPVDACLFLRKVFNEDLEWVRGQPYGNIDNPAEHTGFSKYGMASVTPTIAAEPLTAEGGMAEDPRYTAALVQALANTYIYSKLTWLLLRDKPIDLRDLPQSIYPHRRSSKDLLRMQVHASSSAVAADENLPELSDSAMAALVACNHVLAVVDDIFMLCNFDKTRRQFVAQQTHAMGLDDRRVQVCCYER